LTRPALSIVIPTRNRPEAAASCVSRVLDCEPGDFELILVDQSDGPETEKALAFAATDPRVRYLRSSLRGAAAARNAGIEQSQGELIAFTDDDCIVAPDWVRGIRQVFDSDQTIEAMFGRVAVPPAPPGTWAAGFAASPKETQWCGYPRFPDGWGMSANMACRRHVFDTTGTFDQLLGPGSPLKASEDFDFFIRMRKAGIKIVDAEQVSVDHVGYRGGHDLHKLLCGYFFSVGAAFLKHVRRGEGALLAILARRSARLLAGGCKQLLLGKGSGGLHNFACLMRGTFTSFRYKIDHKGQLYIAPVVVLRESEQAETAQK